MRTMLLFLPLVLGQFEPAPLMSHFAAEQPIVLAPYHADLVLGVNLTEVSSTLDASCDVMVLLFNRSSRHAPIGSNIPKPMLSQFSAMCRHSTTLWDSYLDLATGDSTRQPRFLTAILSCLAVGVGSYIFGSSHALSQTDKQLLADDKHFVQVLKAFDHRAKVQHHDILELAAVVHSSITKSEAKFDSLDAATMVLANFQAQTLQLIPFTRALESVLIHRRLSPGLLNLDVLKSKMDHLALQVAKQHSELVSHREIDLFQFPLSFASFTNGMMKIVVHVPVTATGLKFNVFRFVSAPILSQDVYYEVLSDSVHLAVSEDRQSYIELSAIDFNDCLSLDSFRVCTSHRAVRAAASDGCLWSIFRSDPAMLLRTCHVARSATAARAFYLGNSRFLLFHPVAQETQLICGSGKSADTSFFKGFQTVQIPPFCKAKSKFYSLFGTTRVTVENAHVKFSPISLQLQNFSHSDSLQDIDNFISEAQKIVHIPNIDPPIIPLDSWWTWSAVGGVVLAFTVIGLLCLCLFIRFRRNMQVLRRYAPDATLTVSAPATKTSAEQDQYPRSLPPYGAPVTHVPGQA